VDCVEGFRDVFALGKLFLGWESFGRNPNGRRSRRGRPVMALISKVLRVRHDSLLNFSSAATEFLWHCLF
jgi:hypothetical protein